MEILGVVIGAALGAVLALATEPLRYRFIERPRAVRELRPGLLAEAGDVSMRAVITTRVLRRRHGTLNAEHVEWAVRELTQIDNDESRRHAEMLKEELRLSASLDEAQRELVRQRGIVNDRASLFPSIEMPFLDAQVHRLGVFTLDTQAALLRLRSEVRIFNSLSDDVRTFSALTFAGDLSSDNHERAIQNMRGSEVQLILRSEQIARAAARLRELRLE